MSIIYLAIAPTHGKVPNPYALVVCCTYQVFTIWMEHNVSHPVVMARQSEHTSASAHLKYSNLLVPRSSSDKILQFALLNFFLLLDCSIDLDALIRI